MELWLIGILGFVALFVLCCVVAIVEEHIRQAKKDKEKR